MRISIIFRCLTGFLCLWWLVGTPEVVSQDASQVSNGGLSGVRITTPGSEVQIYFIELTEIVGGQDAFLKTGFAGTEEIRFSITDLVGIPSGLVASDINAFNFYRSADAVFDGGDIFTGKSTGFAGPGAQTIDFGGAAFLDDIPDAPASIFFVITARIGPNAIVGHSFRLGLAGGHIDMRDIPPPGAPTVYTLGAAIAASDLNRIVIGARRLRDPEEIPVGLEWMAGLGFFGYGVYWLLRNGVS